MVVTSSSWAPTPTSPPPKHLVMLCVHPGVSPLTDQNPRPLIVSENRHTQGMLYGLLGHSQLRVVITSLSSLPWHPKSTLNIHIPQPSICTCVSSTCCIHLIHCDATDLAVESWSLSLHPWLLHTEQFVPGEVLVVSLSTCLQRALSSDVGLTDFNTLYGTMVYIYISPILEVN